MHPESSKINDMTKNMGCGTWVISHFGALLVFFRQIVSAIPFPPFKIAILFSPQMLESPIFLHYTYPVLAKFVQYLIIALESISSCLEK